MPKLTQKGGTGHGTRGTRHPSESGHPQNPPREDVANLDQGESIITSLESVKQRVLSRYNPLRALSARRLALWLDDFEYGEMRELGILWEQIAERDDTIKGVKSKREKSVSGLDVAYLAMPNSGQEGITQALVLEKFWKSIRATNAYDRNQVGGLRLLIQQMMTAVSYRYSCHHIVWSPRASGITATFEHVPVWLFENRSGKLKYLTNPYDVYGVMMDEDEWLVTTGEGLMVSCCIGWLAKRETYNDWLIFSKFFAIPGVIGRTKAPMGSPEGKAMRAAVLAFGEDMKGVIYNDDGTIKDPIQIIQAKGSDATSMPMPSIIDRIDRKFVTLYRGADLNTISSRGGMGTGASLQQDETRILLADDIAMIEERLASISQMVIEWTFGQGVEILAEVKLLISKPATPQQLAQPLDADINPAQEIPAGTTAPDIVPTDPTATEELDNTETQAPAMRNFQAALAEDMKPLGAALESALKENDAPAFRAALKRISDRLPDFAHSDAMQALISHDLAAAMIAGANS